MTCGTPGRSRSVLRAAVESFDGCGRDEGLVAANTLSSHAAKGTNCSVRGESTVGSDQPLRVLGDKPRAAPEDVAPILEQIHDHCTTFAAAHEPHLVCSCTPIAQSELAIRVRARTLDHYVEGPADDVQAKPTISVPAVAL